MSPSLWWMLLVVVLLLAGAAVLWREHWAGAARQDAAELEASGSALDAELMRRTLAARELATAGGLDRASSVIVLRCVGDVLDAVDAGTRAEGTWVGSMGPERLEAEEQLTEALRRAFDDHHGGAGGSCESLGGQAAHARDALALATERVHRRRVRHNELAARVRRRALGRTGRLLGLGPARDLPELVQVEDDIPALRPGSEQQP